MSPFTPMSHLSQTMLHLVLAFTLAFAAILSYLYARTKHRETRQVVTACALVLAVGALVVLFL